MFNKINFEALDRSDMETAATFVEGIGTVAGIISTAEASEQELRASLNVIWQALSVAGTVLCAGTEGDPLIKPMDGRGTLQNEVA